MALVRVYCGLASADSADRPASAGSTLTSAVVDDAGRLLHVCEIGDDPAGYARLVALLVERSGGPSGVAIAADSDDHTVTSLLSAAGRPLAIADDDAVDDFAERFADDDSLEEMQSPPAERRAVGLARALQAGALSAVSLPAPRDLAGYKQVLSAHAALASGRHSAAVALREVLRELYPAALRAYPDPAEPVALAVLDALPEPGMLGGTIARGRDVSVAADAIAAHLAADGVADAESINEAVTALRVAIAETPRRAAVSRALTSAVAETVRQAVASVRACDAGCDALVGALSARVSAPSPAPGRRAAARRGEPVADLAGAGVPALRAVTPGDPQPTPSGGRRSRPEPVSGGGLPTPPRPLGPPPVAPAPVAPPPTAPIPVAPAASINPAASVNPLERREPAGPPRRGDTTNLPRRDDTAGLPGRGDTAGLPRRDEVTPANRPVSAPPPPPPGITPIPPAQRGPHSPAEAGEPFRPTLTTAAINNARAERQRTVIPPRPKTTPDSPTGGFAVTDLSVPVPAPRPEQQDAPPPGSRANWPLVNNPEDPADSSPRNPVARSAQERPDRQVDAPTDPGRADRVTPPWLADDLPPEPPVLRLVEPPPAGRSTRIAPQSTGRDATEPAALAGSGPAPRGGESPAERTTFIPPIDRASRAGRDAGSRDVLNPSTDPRLETPPLRLVDRPEPARPERPAEQHRRPERPAEQYHRPERPAAEQHRRPERPAAEQHRPERPAAEQRRPPVSDEGDGDLLIFAQAKSAWFVGHTEEAEVDWSSLADTGWQAAEQAARPVMGDATPAGLPRRVPQANLVPGSPLREERPLRIVRDAASLAENTTGYFRGWRRGQEIGGFAVGGRPGREAAGGWDFSRDTGDRDDDREYEYRSAGYRS
ncbi:transposase [Micromonospora sp. WMMD882]|uniref:transposase n=1 Tax=Micromonospora sp. WMMD882 TaxID=3015151 RepID=UPI00248B4ACA|nr:transposase [Micromonospora sp. WMMD882]WBB77531.1 transposase [Micromonospora sp. WMMD882]